MIPLNTLRGAVAPGRAVAAATLSAAQPEARATSKLLADPKRMQDLERAVDKQIKANTKGKRGGADLRLQEPYLKTPSSRMEAVKDILTNSPDAYASNSIGSTSGDNRIRINPNLDESMFMHELGHITSRQGRAGEIARALRDNPQLTAALSKAALLAPIGAAALIPGDDDAAISTGLAIATAMPSLVDEAMANQNALSMMKEMGNRATLGQRGRMAANYLTYLAPAIMSGLVGNVAGNFADDELTSALGYG